MGLEYIQNASPLAIVAMIAICTVVGLAFNWMCGSFEIHNPNEHYQQAGFADREEYLADLQKKYPHVDVNWYANFYGQEHDFTLLIDALRSYPNEL